MGPRRARDFLRPRGRRGKLETVGARCAPEHLRVDFPAMTTGWPRMFALGIAAYGLAAAGCAQDSSWVGSNSTVGSLKTSVTQLEHDNAQMRKQVADLESEKRRLSEKLAQERVTNDDLSTRLDNARGLLSRKGLGESASDTSQADADWSDSRPSRTAPASRSGASPASHLLPRLAASGQSRKPTTTTPTRMPARRVPLPPAGSSRVPPALAPRTCAGCRSPRARPIRRPGVEPIPEKRVL